MQASDADRESGGGGRAGGGRPARVLSFVCLTYGLSLLLYGVYRAAGGRWNTLGSMAMAVVYMYMPALSTVILHRWVFREPVVGPLGVSFRLNRFWLHAWLLPPLLAIAAFGVSLLMPGTSYSPGMDGLFARIEGLVPPEKMSEVRRQMAALPVHPVALAFFQALGAGPTINAVAAFGEELGWRGFLHRELAPLGFLRSSAIIGVVWGLWHAPLILEGHNYPQHPALGVAMMTVFCVLLAPLLAAARIHGKSVIAAAVMHGSINATAGLAIVLLSGGNDLTTGLTGAAGFIVLLIVDLAVVLYVRRPTRNAVTS
jgi:uncharacterized protein